MQQSSPGLGAARPSWNPLPNLYTKTIPELPSLQRNDEHGWQQGPRGFHLGRPVSPLLSVVLLRLHPGAIDLLNADRPHRGLTTCGGSNCAAEHVIFGSCAFDTVDGDFRNA